MKRFVLAATLAVASLGAFAQADFPNRPITLLVGFAPGGAADVTARVVAKKLAENMGQPVTVDNRGGAGGNIVHQQVAAGPADGYTILLGSVGPLAISPHLSGVKLGYDPLKDFAPLSMAAMFPQVLVVPASIAAKNIAEYVALAKKPGSLEFASSGIGSIPHLAGELFNQHAGMHAVHVPYKGGGAVITDLLSGRIASFYASPATAAPYLESGKLRALAVTGSKRSPFMKDVPTIAESGYPGVVADNWYAFVASAKLPVAIQERWNRELVKALADPEVKEQMARHFLEPVSSTREELRAYIKKEYETWGRVIKSANVKGE